MADIIMHWTDHWMDTITPEQIQEYSNKNIHFLDKYNSRTQRGDIISVFPDGRLLDTQHGNKFVIIRVPGLSVEDAKAYIGRLYIFDGSFDDITGEPNMKLVKKNKFKINVDGLPITIINAINKKRVVTLNLTTLTTNIIEKTY